MTTRATGTIKPLLRNLYRANSRYCPAVYNAQQRASVSLRASLGMVHEDAFNALPLFDLPRNALCLDIGANCGQSIVSVKQVLPGARIEAFEPNPGLRAGLNRTAARFRSVNCHDFALGERSEHRRLYVPACAGILFHQLSSLERPSRPG